MITKKGFEIYANAIKEKNKNVLITYEDGKTEVLQLLSSAIEIQEFGANVRIIAHLENDVVGTVNKVEVVDENNIPLLTTERTVTKTTTQGYMVIFDIALREVSHGTTDIISI